MNAAPEFEDCARAAAEHRLSIKDVFRPGVQPDRVFTFMAPNVWGTAKLEAKGGVTPQAVRLSTTWIRSPPRSAPARPR